MDDTAQNLDLLRAAYPAHILVGRGVRTLAGFTCISFKESGLSRWTSERDPGSPMDIAPAYERNLRGWTFPLDRVVENDLLPHLDPQKDPATWAVALADLACIETMLPTALPHFPELPDEDEARDQNLVALWQHLVLTTWVRRWDLTDPDTDDSDMPTVRPPTSPLDFPQALPGPFPEWNLGPAIRRHVELQQTLRSFALHFPNALRADDFENLDTVRKRALASEYRLMSLHPEMAPPSDFLWADARKPAPLSRVIALIWRPHRKKLGAGGTYDVVWSLGGMRQMDYRRPPHEQDDPVLMGREYRLTVPADKVDDPVYAFLLARARVMQECGLVPGRPRWLEPRTKARAG